MTKVTAQMSVSLDGFYAGPRASDDANWMESAEALGFFRITRWAIDALAWRERQGFAGGERGTNSDIIAETFEAAGAYVMGRRMADGGEGPWGEEPPFHAPVFVVTHRPRPTLVRKGGTSFTYVTDGVASAIEQARAAANGKDVAIAGGGSLLRQVLKAGLLDELELHIAPVVLGTGMRLLDTDLDLPETEAIELTPTRVVHTPEVTHVRYRVNGRAGLVLDDRGSGAGAGDAASSSAAPNSAASGAVPSGAVPSGAVPSGAAANGAGAGESIAP
jgi:dihydrofolate reductase